MDMNCVDKIPLTNGLTVEVFDLSRLIAADTTKVELLFKIEIKMDKAFFSSDDQYELTRRIFGDILYYEYKMERTFVDNTDRQTIFNEFMDTFKKDSLPYLSHKDFARRFCLSKYSDIVKHPYKYQRPS
ncbi:MAG: hypothetical protein JXA41_06155 [Deltaproteobacteria bacterium]|nr:hypothetical protein [Deltaproteobacteria bacterium]